MKTLALNCNQCGANLSVPERTRFVTCTYCETSLRVVHDAGAAYTETLDRIEDNTEEISNRLSRLEYMNELERLDREWMLTRETLLVTSNHGNRSEPSAAGSVGGAIIATLFGVFWISIGSVTGAPWFVVAFGMVVVGIVIAHAVRGAERASEYARARAAYERRRREIEARVEKVEPRE